MEGQANIQGVEATGAATPQAAAISTPAPITTPASPMPQNTMAMGSEMSSGGGGSQFFKSIDWVEIGMGALGALGLYFVIYYYKNKVIFEKMEKSQIQKQLDVIKSELEELKSSHLDGTTAYTGGF